jgi:hypothetical protein
MLGILTRTALLLICLSFWPFTAEADRIALEVPVDCTLGKICYIQNYFDDDPSSGRKDYACGRLSYDGHQGTDFRLTDYVAMESGVAVLAAAPGVVKAVRDGMADVSVREVDRMTLHGRDAGNGVVIAHGQGWETQYSHLKRGSVVVHAGEQVEAGQKLGLIGLSGNTEFPHVDFAIRYRGKPLDPFAGPDGFRTCGDTSRSLWSETALRKLAYQPTGALGGGFAAERPDAESARHGRYRTATLSVSAPALVFWVDVFGAQAGDVQAFEIFGPDNRLVHRQADTLSKSNVSWFAFAGRRSPPGGWPAGRYTGQYELSREGRIVVQISRSIRLE